MARPNKSGLDYFPLDVDIFEDDKLKFIRVRFDEKGELIVIKILAKIYRGNGYYTEWNEDISLIFADSAGKNITANLANDVVHELVKRGFFDKGIFDRFNVLTSKGIQKRYITAVKDRKDVEIISDYWLIGLPKNTNTTTFIISSAGNEVSSAGNEVTSAGNAQINSKKNKSNETKDLPKNTNTTTFTISSAGNGVSSAGNEVNRAGNAQIKSNQKKSNETKKNKIKTDDNIYQARPVDNFNTHISTLDLSDYDLTDLILCIKNSNKFKNLDIDTITAKYPGERERALIYDICVVIIKSTCYTGASFIINKRYEPAEKVKKAIFELSHDNFEYVLNQLKNYAAEINNFRLYCIAALYNASINNNGISSGEETFDSEEYFSRVAEYEMAKK